MGLDGPMHRSEAWLRVPGTDEHRHVVRWSLQTPLLAFPSEGVGVDYGNNGMLEAIAPLVDRGPRHRLRRRLPRSTHGRQLA